jgi:hypothetical protein
MDHRVNENCSLIQAKRNISQNSISSLIGSRSSISEMGHSCRYCHVPCLVRNPRYRTCRTQCGPRPRVVIWRRANASEGRSWAVISFGVAGAPGTIRTCNACLRRAAVNRRCQARNSFLNQAQEARIASQGFELIARTMLAMVAPKREFPRQYSSPLVDRGFRA